MRLFSQILRGQSIVGSDSCGGDRRYLVYLVVYPAEYGNSGVMTFIIATAMTVYNPDSTWSEVKE